MIKKIKKVTRKTPDLLVIAISVLVGLMLAEGVVRIFQLDWRYIKKFLYYQKVDLEAHQPDPNPVLRFRLRPGVHTCTGYVTPFNLSGKGSHTVSINSLGARGPERSATKPEGVFRIVCVGGSNVYGAAVNDDETWPAQLEAKLNSTSPGRYEVWNFGVSAFVPSQMVVLAEEAIERYDPDMIIFALSNRGTPAFLWNSPVKSYFEKDPKLWEALLSEDSLSFLPIASYKTKIELVQKSALFRLSLLGVSAITGRKLFAKSEQTDQTYETQNLRSTREFIQKYKERVTIVIFICPAKICTASDFTEYYRGLDVPVFKLRAKGMPEEYADIHPPFHVAKWYAEKIAEWLFKNHYLPEEGAHSRNSQGNNPPN